MNMGKRRELVIVGSVAVTLLWSSTTQALAQSPQGGFAHVINAARAHPGCLGVETGQTSSGKRIIFASNMDDPKGRNFDLYKVNVDGTALERITYNDTFDGFPMFSPDGKKLVFASNRDAKVRGETNIFIADWIE